MNMIGMQKLAVEKPSAFKSLAYGVLAGIGAIAATVIVFALLGALTR